MMSRQNIFADVVGGSRSGIESGGGGGEERGGGEPKGEESVGYLLSSLLSSGGQEDGNPLPPPNRTWPMFHHHRGQVRSCIEFSAASTTTTTVSALAAAAAATTPLAVDQMEQIGGPPISISGASGSGNVRTSSGCGGGDRSRFSNPFLEFMFGASTAGANNVENVELNGLHRVLDDDEDNDYVIDDDDDDDDDDEPCGSNSHSHSLNLSLLSNGDGDTESSGTLSEVFDSLSRFSEVCLASAEAINPTTAVTTPQQHYSSTSSTPMSNESCSSSRRPPFSTMMDHPVMTASASQHLIFDSTVRLRQQQQQQPQQHQQQPNFSRRGSQSHHNICGNSSGGGGGGGGTDGSATMSRTMTTTNGFMQIVSHHHTHHHSRTPHNSLRRQQQQQQHEHDHAHEQFSTPTADDPDLIPCLPDPTTIIEGERRASSGQLISDMILEQQHLHNFYQQQQFQQQQHGAQKQQQSSNSRVWSDYGSGSDAGHNSLPLSLSATSTSSSLAHHHGHGGQGHHRHHHHRHHHRDSGGGGIGSVAEALHVNSIVTTVRESQPLVTCLDWQERCMELEVALQRFGEQAARVRLLLRDKLQQLEQRVVEAETRADEASTRADEAEDKVRVMEQQLSEATSNAPGSWAMGEEEKLCTLENAVREKERVISRLECQVEEQRLLRLQESRQVEEKASRIKDWVSNKLRDLEDQNEHLRELNCSLMSQLNSLQSKSRDRHSTEDSSRGSYEGDRPPSDESPPPDSADRDGQVNQQQTLPPRPLSATAACLAAIRRRSGAFDTPEERRQRRKGNLSSGSNSGTTSSLTQDRRSQNSRSSRVDSGSVDMETPQSLSPRSPLDALEALDASLPALPQQHNNTVSTSSSSSTMTMTNSSPHVAAIMNHNGPVTSNNNNNHVIISSPAVHPVPLPVPVTVPKPLCISQTSSASPATPVEMTMIGGAESTQSLNNRVISVPIVPPRRCRTRSPTPNTSKGNTPGSNYSPPTEEEDASVLKARLDAECQQLARDLQAAVRELVRPELSFGRARAIDETHDYSEIYTPSCEKGDILPLGLSQPPPPPIHRFPSWESRIYEVAAGGLKVPSKEDTSSSGEIASTAGRQRSCHSLGINFSIPVYTTVKGRASQIRSAPFSGDSTDSSDGEEMGSGSGGSGPSHPISSGETDISSPVTTNSLSPLHRSSSSPSKSLRREPSMESEMSDDYAIPPDAFASETNSMDIALSAGCHNLTPGLSVNSNSNTTSGAVTTNSVESSPRKESLEKSGYLTKLGGKLKTWRKRWFVLKNGVLTYWNKHDVNRRSAGREILLDENCRIIRGEGAATFEIATGKKTYYLTADSIGTVDEWVRILQNVVRRNATKLVLSMEDSKPTIQGWLVKVKNGHAKRCWCVLIGKMFLSFKSPPDTVTSGQINMRDARVEDVDHVSDSDNDEKDEGNPTNPSDSALTIGIFPSHQSPIYLHLPTKQDKDAWLYHLTIVSGRGPSAGTQFEQLIHKLMEVDGDPNCSLWKNPLLLHSKESITSPLTSMSSLAIQNEGVKLFKSCQLFMSVPLEPSAIEYHVGLAQNTLQLCLDYPELQTELICALVKQTSRSMTFKNSPQVNRTLSKIKHSRFLLNATQSLFVCDSSSSNHKVQHQNSTKLSQSPSGSHRTNNHITAAPSSPGRTRGGSGRSSPAKTKSKGSSSSVPSSPLLSHNHSMHNHALSTESKSNIRSFVYIQGWQLLALSVSLFLPKNNKLLWYLKQHLQRNVDTKSESGKYAAYCQRSIERTLANGPRHFKPSRMEVLSILMKNPFHHSLPHSVPVHFLNGGYQVVGFDGSTTVEEFLLSLCHEIGCREQSQSGFALCEDDPFEKDLQHTLKHNDKICDVISQWETVLREKGSGKFETRRAVTLSFVSRIYRRSGILQETDKERLLLCYQTNQAVVSGRFPLTRELSIELASLMAQIDCGDYKPERGKGSGGSQMLVVQTLEKYYPIRYRENLPQEEFKALCDTLIEKWILLKGKSSLDCVRIYLTCTRKWPFFGATLFSVKIRGTHTIEDGSSVWAAVCEDGIAILDHQTLQQIGKYSYSSVQTFGGAQDDHFMVVVDDLTKKRRLLFGGMSKHKVLEMTQLVADYINACSHNSMYGPSHGTGSGITRHSSLKSCRFQSSSNTLPPSTPRLERKHLESGPSTPSPLQRCDSGQTYRTPRP